MECYVDSDNDDSDAGSRPGPFLTDFTVLLSRYPMSLCDTYRDTWVTMRYVSRYLSIGLISVYLQFVYNNGLMAIECQ